MNSEGRRCKAYSGCTLLVRVQCEYESIPPQRSRAKAQLTLHKDESQNAVRATISTQH